MAAAPSNEYLPLFPISQIPDHPPYAQMVSEAITTLHEEGGLREPSISNYIRSNYTDLPPAHDNLLHYHLSKLVRLKEIIQLRPGFYTLFRNPNPNPNPKWPGKRGRPSKVSESAEPVALLSGPQKGSGKKRKADLEERRGIVVPEKRGRGRPRKEKAAGNVKNGGPPPVRDEEAFVQPLPLAVEGGDVPSKRGRGRPRKVMIVQVPAET